jgi:hypothetical protein
MTDDGTLDKTFADMSKSGVAHVSVSENPLKKDKPISRNKMKSRLQHAPHEGWMSDPNG